MKIYRVLGNEGRITIPFVIRQRIGFRPQDIVSFEPTDKRSVLVRLEVIREEEPKVSSREGLFHFLDALSVQDQWEALVYLSTIMADRQHKEDDHV